MTGPIAHAQRLVFPPMSNGNTDCVKMEEHEQDSDCTQQQDEEEGAVPLLAVRNAPPKRRSCNKKCLVACSRGTHCVLAIPFLAIAALSILSVSCYYDVENSVGGCLLFGSIKVEGNGTGILTPGPRAVCLTVICGEIALCAFAILSVIVLVIQAFLSKKL